jgi:acetyl-CoA C-acetyltransferase/acetyl-CoA acyltransferase
MLVGGTESMSNMPLLFGDDLKDLFAALTFAKTPGDKLQALSKFRPQFLKPRVARMEGLTDPISGLNMGQTAEVLVKEYGISRKEQDEFALMSHVRALAARQKLREEIVPVFVPPKYEKAVEDDTGVREKITLEDLSKLRPYFERHTGTVTVGNACQVSDGACAILVMSEEKAKDMGFTPLGFIRAYAYAGVDPRRMGIGPAFAIPEVLAKAGLKLSDMELMEINEAFAAQVIACERQLEISGTGKLNREKLNVNGGAIALGHPVGTTGNRLILTLLKEMKRRNLHLGLASLCVGGGQGAAIILER